MNILKKISLLLLINSTFSHTYDGIDRIVKIAQFAKDSVVISYQLTQRYLLQKDPQQQAYLNAQSALSKPFPPAAQTFKELNAHPSDPFLMSIGTSMSQMEHTDNILHPEYVSKLLYKKFHQQKNPGQWLMDRWGYVVAATPDIFCNQCQTTTSLQNITATDPKIKKILAILINNKNATSLQLSKCPECKSDNIIQQPQTLHVFTDTKQNQLAQQLRTLKVDQQPAAKNIPSYRLSIELADIIDHDGTLNPKKLQSQATRIQQLRNPLLFMHHYTNPQCKPHLFEHADDATWFAQQCAEIVKASPGLTHVCPISQIMGFGLQVSRQKMLPPFSCNIDQNLFLQNIVNAQVAASAAMKKINPNLKVLVSHQWKPMKPQHNSTNDPRYPLEYLVCSIADRMYNQKFVQLMQPYLDSFDGIALSVYPALYFNGITPCGNNCSGTLDPQAALEAIVQTNKAFPNKDIYIVETGCNSSDSVVKKQFVDMTLYVCKLARDIGIPVKACYFWGHTNESYFEWNKLPNTSHFGAFESFTPESINEYGKYLQGILQQK